MYIGQPQSQYIELSFDTGSNWLAVTSSLGNSEEKQIQNGAYDVKVTKSGYPVSTEIV